ncbi:hypothetical protein [Halobaculum sp. MBLA0143]|uniref:hypothetical protein n=1 Tax=Halobaculum sp. MBLA0143 TaxID=3079933 RepID=UPI003523CE91
MTRARLLVVCVVVVVAGCGGLAGSDGADGNTVNPALEGTPTATPTPTASPVPTPTVSPTPTETPTLPEALPPALGPETVDAGRLAASHARSLASQSRTVVRTITVRSTDGELLGRSRVVLRDDGDPRGGRLAVVQTVSGPRPGAVDLGERNVSYWGNDSLTVSRTESADGNVTYGFDRTPFPPIARSDTTGQAAVAFAFRAANVTRVSRVGTTDPVFLVEGSAAVDSAYEAYDVRLTATVEPSGVVRSFEVTYTRDRGGQLRRVTRRFRVTNRDATTVSRPSWYRQAVAAGTDGETATPRTRVGPRPCAGVA